MENNSKLLWLVVNVWGCVVVKFGVFEVEDGWLWIGFML